MLSIEKLGAVVSNANNLKGDVLELSQSMRQTGNFLVNKVRQFEI